MGDAGDDHHAIGIVDGVDDPMVAHPDPEIVAALEPDDPCRPRLQGESIKGDVDSRPSWFVDALVCLDRVRVQPDFVWPAL